MGDEARGPGGKLGPPPCVRPLHAGGAAPGDDAPPDRPSPDPDAEPGRDPEAPPAPSPPAPRCDLCGAAMIERHCKLTCPRCGYQRDCSDP